MTNTVSSIVSDEALDSIIQIESNGNPNIRAATSSALGLGQFLNATWLGTVKQHRPDVFSGRSNAQVLAMRTEPTFAIEMLARFTEDNMNIVGRNCAPGDLYLAHFLGAGMAQRFFRAQANTNAVTLAGEQAAKANKTIFYETDGRAKTTGQIRAWAAAKMAKAGGKGWVKKYYKPNNTVEVPEPESLEPEFDGDPDLREVQTDLKSMNYNPGDLDGLWGGGTLGALGAFILDRGRFMQAPMSMEEFHAGLDLIKLEIDRAVEEDFHRPIKESRKTDDTKVIATVAPEVVPVKEGADWTLRGAIGAVGTGAVNLLSKGWDWLWNNHDSIPTDPGTVSKAFGYVSAIPPGVWIIVIGGALGAIWYFKLRPGVQKITESVNTGQRL